MRNSIFAFCLTLLACSSPLQAADDPSEPIRLTLAWDLSLDAQGHVTSLAALPNKRLADVPQIRERLEQQIRTWPFTPGAVAGRPAATDTRLVVSFSLRPNDQNSYRISFDDVRTGGHILRTVMPQYPISVLRSAAPTGMVVVRAAYDADGKVLSAVVETGSPPIAAGLLNASISAVKKWRFQPERVDGHGIAGSQVMPICYSVRPIESRAAPSPPCKWDPPGTHASIGEGESLAIDPAARLNKDVVGHAL